MILNFYQKKRERKPQYPEIEETLTIWFSTLVKLWSLKSNLLALFQKKTSIDSLFVIVVYLRKQ